MGEKLKIKPYARLITMLGDQLIKNEKIALVELIKNSYDADASWVKVDFVDFNEDFSITPNSRIVIEDDGCGMNEEIIRKHWLNPATPEKLKRKAEAPNIPIIDIAVIKAICRLFKTDQGNPGHCRNCTMNGRVAERQITYYFDGLNISLSRLKRREKVIILSCWIEWK